MKRATAIQWKQKYKDRVVSNQTFRLRPIEEEELRHAKDYVDKHTDDVRETICGLLKITYQKLEVDANLRRESPNMEVMLNLLKCVAYAKRMHSALSKEHDKKSHGKVT